MPSLLCLSLVIVVRRLDAGFRSFLSMLERSGAAASIDAVFVAVGLEVTEAELSQAVATTSVGRVLTLAAKDAASARRVGLANAETPWAMFPDPSDVFADDAIDVLVGSVMEAPAEVGRLVLRVEGRVRHGRGESTDVAEADIARTVFRRVDVPADGIALVSGADELLAFDLVAHGREAAGATVASGVISRAVGMRATADAQTAWFRQEEDHYDRLLSAVEARLSLVGEELAHARLLARVLTTLVRLETHQATCATFDAQRGERFVARLRTALRQLPAAAFEGGETADTAPLVHDIVAAIRGDDPAPVARIDDVDVREGVMRIAVPGFGPADVRMVRRGREVAVAHHKRRAVKAFGVTVAVEAIMWVPACGDLSVTVGARSLPLRVPGGAGVRRRARAGEVARGVRRGRRRVAASDDALSGGVGSVVGRALRRARRSWLSRAAAVRVLARLPFVAGRYRDAWLMMDRADAAGDNAEHFYRWLVENHPERNAWFVVRKDSPDYGRLAAEGFRLVGYRTLQHHLLLHRARVYLSSQVGVAVSRPIFDRHLIDSPPWSFVFLQHGVIYNDLSTWLNTQRMRLCVATTHREFDALAGDDSPYVLTDREVRLTGMPRLDRLRRLADASPRAGRRSIVIAPTWRDGLLVKVFIPGATREPKGRAAQSPFARMMKNLIAHPGFQRLADKGSTATLIPHPNVASLFPSDALPAHMRVAHYGTDDVQALLADAAVVLTDYSSVAFDAAFAGAGVVYLQPEDASIYGTTHTVARGNFEFERDGFGPVCRSVDEALDAVSDAVQSGLNAHFLVRARAAFGYWDDGACQRLFEAVAGLEA